MPNEFAACKLQGRSKEPGKGEWGVVVREDVGLRPSHMGATCRLAFQSPQETQSTSPQVRPLWEDDIPSSIEEQRSLQKAARSEKMHASPLRRLQQEEGPQPPQFFLLGG